MQPLKFFCSKPHSNPAVFEQERPQKPRHGTVSTLHQPKYDILPFFKFLQKKVSQLNKKAPAHFYPTLGVVICKNHFVRPLHSFKKCRKFLLSSLETFFCRNLENVGMSFWANVMLRQSHVWASRAYPAQKPQGLRLVCSKKFSMAAFFLFQVT